MRTAAGLHATGLPTHATGLPTNNSLVGISVMKLISVQRFISSVSFHHYFLLFPLHLSYHYWSWRFVRLDTDYALHSPINSDLYVLSRTW